jgi:hypothetical protein
MRLEECRVSGVGAIQCRLAVAGHHHVKNEIVAIFVGIHPECTDLVCLLCLAWIFEGKAQEGGLAVCALDNRQLADFRRRIGGDPARIACACEVGQRLLLVALMLPRETGGYHETEHQKCGSTDVACRETGRDFLGC